jgi:CRISPR-associated exonuclease Cas4
MEKSDKLVLEGNDIEYTGTQVNYYFVCKRKLWFFSKGLEQEVENDLVILGRLLHEHSYNRKLKEIEIGRIKIDFVGDKGEIHEIKRSRKIENAHIYQLLYYLYYLKRNGAGEFIGIIHYPLLKKTKRYTLTKENEEKIESILKDIEKILSLPQPPAPSKLPYCKHCAYNELCWI